MLDKIIGLIHSLTELGLGIIGQLGVVFKSSLEYHNRTILGLDIVGSVVGLVKQLVAEGLVGLVTKFGYFGVSILKVV